MASTITATATEASNGNTSEFAACYTLPTLPSGQAPVADLMASSTSFCPGTCIDYTDLSTNSPTSWEWVFPGGTPSTSTLQNPTNICYSAQGLNNATLIATNSFGADTITYSLYITVFNAPEPELGSDTTICSNETGYVLNAGSGSGYSWSTSETTQTISIDASTLGVGTHSYSVTVTNQDGCSGSDSINVTVVNCDGIEEFNSLDVSVYPNPTGKL